MWFSLCHFLDSHLQRKTTELKTGQEQKSNSAALDSYDLYEPKNVHRYKQTCTDGCQRSTVSYFTKKQLIPMLNECQTVL